MEKSGFSVGSTRNTNSITFVPTNSSNSANIKKTELSETIPLSSSFFLDQSPKTRLRNISKQQGLIDEKYSVIKHFEFDFEIDSSQEELLENILETSVTFNYRTEKKGKTVSSCQFKLKELFSDIRKKFAEYGNIEVQLSGGIVRRLFTLSAVSCTSLFDQCKILLPKNLIAALLEQKRSDLPDIDVRFDFGSLNENPYKLLETSRKFPLNFVCSKLPKKNITAEKIEEFSLNKWYLRNEKKDLFATVNLAEAKFSFSKIPSSLELLFISDLASRYMCRRDNLFLEISPKLTEGKEKLRFHSVENKQLEAILHVLLGVVTLNASLDQRGFIRIISLFGEGETLANPLSELEIHKEKFLKTKDQWIGWDLHFGSHIKRCLENHYPDYLKDPQLVDAFIYNLISIFPDKCAEICIAWEGLNTPPSPLFEMLCRKGFCFEEVEAALGLVAIADMASTGIAESKPSALLCDHGQRLFIQLKLPKTEHHILIPFEPEKFVKILENSKKTGWIEFFDKMRQGREASEDPSLLLYCRLRNENLLNGLLKALAESKSGFLEKVCIVLKKSLALPPLSAEKFADKILSTENAEVRLFWFNVLLQQTEDAALYLCMKNSDTLQNTLLKDPLEKDSFIREWISLLTQSRGQKEQNLALSLLERYKAVAAKLLQNSFTVDWIGRLLKINGCLPAVQKLLLMLQKRQNEKRILPEIEQKLVMEALQHKEAVLEENLLVSCKILENYYKRSGEKPDLSIAAFDFIGKLPEEFSEKATQLLVSITEQASFAQKQKSQQPWLEQFKREILNPKNSAQKIAEFWKKGELLGVWKGIEALEAYQELLLSLSERLAKEDILKGFEFLERLIALKPEQERFNTRINKIFDSYFIHLTKGKHTLEKPLELAEKKLKKHNALISEDKLFLYFVDILQCRIAQKNWNEAEALCDKLLKSPPAKKHSQALTGAVKQILQAKRKKVSESVLIQNKNFGLCVDQLQNFWAENPSEALEVVRNAKSLQEESKATILKTIITALEEKEDVELQKKILFDPLLIDRKTTLNCSCLAKKWLLKSMKSPQKCIEDSLKIFDFYLDKDADSWICCIKQISECREVLVARSFFEKGIPLIQDPKTICESYIEFLDFLIKREARHALEIALFFSAKTSVLYNAWQKADRDLQAKVLALMIQAEIKIGSCEAISEEKEYIFSFYKDLQSLKTEESPLLLPAEYLFLQQLLRSNSIDDNKKGLDLVCEKLKSRREGQSLDPMKKLIQFAIAHTFSDDYLQTPIEQMNTLVEFVYSFEKADLDYCLNTAKMLVAQTEPLIVSKTHKFICGLLSDCPRKQEKGFLELLEIYLFDKIDNHPYPAELKLVYEILRSPELTKLWNRKKISRKFLQELWLCYDKASLKYGSMSHDKIESYHRLWFLMLDDPKCADVWGKKVLSFVRMAAEKSQENLDNVLKILYTGISRQHIFKPKMEKKSKKSTKILEKMSDTELDYCAFLNTLMLNVVALQKKGLSLESHKLLFLCLEKQVPFLKARSLPSEEEGKLTTLLFQYCSQSCFLQVQEIYRWMEEFDVPENHGNIFLPLVKKMLESSAPNDHLKGTILMKGVVCKSKKHLESFKILFDKMTDRVIEAIDTMSKEILDEFVKEVRHVTISQRMFNISASQIHQELLQEASFNYLEKLCAVAEKCGEVEPIEKDLFDSSPKELITLFIALSSLELFSQNISTGNAAELQRFFALASKLFSCLKSASAFLISGTISQEDWIPAIEKALWGIRLVCGRNPKANLDPKIYEVLVENIFVWIKFFEKLESSENLDKNSLEYHKRMLDDIIDLLPDGVKEAFSEYRSKK